jgi:hypothetical protein
MNLIILAVAKKDVMIGFGSVLLVVILFIALTVLQYRKKKQGINDLCEKLKLRDATPLFGDYELQGEYSGREIIIFQTKISRSKTPVYHTHFIMACAIPPEMSFNLRSKIFDSGLVTDLGDALFRIIDRIKDWKDSDEFSTGDAEFDKKWSVSAKDRETFIKVIDNEVKLNLNNMMNETTTSLMNILVDQSSMEVSLQEDRLDYDRVSRILSCILKISEALETRLDDI